MKKKYLGFTLIVVHLLILLTVSTYATIRSYDEFYHEDEEGYEKSTTEVVAKQILDTEPIHSYIFLTGFETGYGFFAPNVASEFIVIFTVADSTGEVLGRRMLPEFENKESMIRFTTTFNLFLEKLKDKKETSEFFEKYLKILVKRMALNVKSTFARAAKVNATVFLYHYPYIEEFNDGKREVIVPIQQYIF